MGFLLPSIIPPARFLNIPGEIVLSEEVPEQWLVRGVPQRATESLQKMGFVSIVTLLGLADSVF